MPLREREAVRRKCFVKAVKRMAKVKFQYAGGVLIARLIGEIDHHAAEELRREIDARLDSCPVEHLCLDCGEVGFMDSAGVGLILGRERRMRSLQGRVTVAQPPAQIQKVLDIANIAYTKKEDEL